MSQDEQELPKYKFDPLSSVEFLQIQPNKRFKILLCTNEYLLRQRLEAAFQEFDCFEIQHAHNGLEAFTKIRNLLMTTNKLHVKTQMYDLVVMNMNELNSIITISQTHKLIEGLFENG